MALSDVSFTFMDRVEEIKLNIKDERWQSALALALTIPDICGGIAFPELIMRYPGGRIRLDKNKNPSRDVGKQYISWFNEYAGEYYKVNESDDKPYICGQRCWQLRCEYLHQNKGFINEADSDDVHFHLGVNCGTSLCDDFEQMPEDKSNVRIDIRQFCLRMCQAAEAYYNNYHTQKDFSLYNTPVLDFAQYREEGAKESQSEEKQSKSVIKSFISRYLK